MAINFTPSELKKVEGRSREDLEVDLQKLMKMTLTKTEQRMKILLEQRLMKMRPDEVPEFKVKDFKYLVKSEYDPKVKSEVDDFPESSFNQIHSSNSDAPDNIKTETPKGFKSDIQLKDHQKTALTWMLYRENSNPRGGILADDMGLGKTTSMIALILHQKNARDKFRKQELDDTFKNDPNILPCFSTLIVLPPGLVDHWKQEIDKCINSGLLKIYTHHGPKRKSNSNELKQFDIVITTYGIVLSELKDGKTSSPLLKIGWERIILDEAQTIKNPTTKTANCCCKLSAMCRWAVTGTPIQNDLNDFYSLVKFLHYHPYDQENYWNVYVTDDKKKSTKKVEALNKYLVLRRTKDELDPITKMPIIELPSKNVAEIRVKLHEDEKACYEMLFENRKSQTTAEEKNSQSLVLKNIHPLSVLTRSRQSAVHMSMIKTAVHDGKFEEDVYNETTTKYSLGCYDEVFHPKYSSAKMTALFEEIDNIIRIGHKFVVISQWLKPLEIVGSRLMDKGVSYSQITGKTKNRQQLVNEFNQDDRGPQAMLLSFKSGGVGLNITGANHLFFMDPHWNPAAEQQAIDRIHRIGQKKDCFIYKLLSDGTIEKKVVDIQKEKTKLIEDVYKGAKEHTIDQSKKILEIEEK